MDLPESFADHPQTIGEIRADKTESAKDWTPRDALISALRAIDSGEIKMNAVVVCWEGTEGEAKMCNYFCASPSVMHSQGILGRIAYRLNVGADPD